jgi:ribosomal protein S18 acetylase RimI-like enzyme
VQIYPAELTDLNACYNMSAAYTTDYVWQLQTRDNEHKTDIQFSTIRLPRSMKVDYPRSPDELFEHWEQDACFLVARDEQDKVIGFLDAWPQPWQSLLWVFNLVVEKDHRRKGVGTLLLQAARRWALQEQFTKIMLEMQTKNFPAISFAQKHGFHYCGYNEHYYANGDIVLFFYQNI